MLFSRLHDILIELNFLDVGTSPFKVKLCSFQGHMSLYISIEFCGCRNKVIQGQNLFFLCSYPCGKTY